MVGRRLCGNEIRLGCLTACIRFSNGRFLFVGQTRRHRSCWDKEHRQVPKTQGSHQHTGHNFVAHTKAERRIKHVMGQRNCGRHGNHITRKQRQIHAGLPLSDPITHRGDTACDLSHRTQPFCCFLDERWIALVRRVRAEHIVVRGDNRDIGHQFICQAILVLARASRHAVGQITARQMASRWARLSSISHASKVLSPSI